MSKIDLACFNRKEINNHLRVDQCETMELLFYREDGTFPRQRDTVIYSSEHRYVTFPSTKSMNFTTPIMHVPGNEAFYAPIAME